MTLPAGADLDPARAARNFSAAAASYDRAAQLQQQTREHLLAQLSLRLNLPQRLLDLGCGTGLGARALQQRYPRAAVVALDRAPGMVRTTRDSGVNAALVGDAQCLPLAPQSCDAILSNLVLQWCPEPQAALAECARVLRPGGWLLCSVPGPATLRELRAAWRQVDEAEHVHRFDPASVWAARAEQAGLQLQNLQVEPLRYVYADVHRLMQGLRDIGARNASAGRRRGLLGRAALQHLARAYAPWSGDDGVSATWEIIYLCLRRPP